MDIHQVVEIAVLSSYATLWVVMFMATFGQKKQTRRQRSKTRSK
jgi:hypothetical protein